MQIPENAQKPLLNVPIFQIRKVKESWPKLGGNLLFQVKSWCAKSKFVKVAVNQEVIHLLSEKGTCVDGYEGNLDYDGCIYSKLKTLMNDGVGCTVPWLLDKSNICDDDARATLAFDIYQKNRRNQKDICETTCHFTNMYFSPMVTGDHSTPDRSWGVFYFRRDIKTTNEYFLYSILSMAAEIGAYVGLLLGASLVNMGMINSFLIDTFCRKDVKEDANAPSYPYKDNLSKVVPVSPPKSKQPYPYRY